MLFMPVRQCENTALALVKRKAKLKAGQAADSSISLRDYIMQNPPFDVTKELPGWIMFWARLEFIPGESKGLAELREDVVQDARDRWTIETLSADPTIAALRKLFHAAGCDPTRHRPSSEALLRRILKGENLPALHPLVDLNNCLSVELAVPCCVMTEGSFSPPLVLRSGRQGEEYDSLRGPYNLEGKPLLVDVRGPLDTPITGSQRAKVSAETEVAWLVAYLPDQAVSGEKVRDTLLQFLRAAPVARSSLLSIS
jgi:DNA/RNA-binding domain of Phe-tRNA-synthetase-like protein